MISEYIVEILLTLISAGALGFCKYLHSQIKEYKKLLAQKENEVISKTIEDKISPIIDKIKELEFQIKEASEKESKDINIIISSWRFRIIQLCEAYLDQGYLTKAQYIQLSEMYNLYHNLGGNGQVTEYYEKTTALPVLSEEEILKMK